MELVTRRRSVQHNSVKREVVLIVRDTGLNWFTGNDGFGAVTCFGAAIAKGQLGEPS